MEDSLRKVIENCNEVIKLACKIDQFGWFEENNNVELLQREMDSTVESFESIEEHIRGLYY